MLLLCNNKVPIILELQKKKRKAAEEKNTSQLAIACKNLGDYYVQQSDYNKALREYKQEAEIYEQQNNKLKHAIANRWIGESYLGLEEFEAALRHVEVYLSEYRVIIKNYKTVQPMT